MNFELVDWKSVLCSENCIIHCFVKMMIPKRFKVSDIVNGFKLIFTFVVKYQTPITKFLQ